MSEESFFNANERAVMGVMIDASKELDIVPDHLAHDYIKIVERVRPLLTDTQYQVLVECGAVIVGRALHDGLAALDARLMLDELKARR